ncbi:MAG TPA: DUF2249 domain-containing protein [Thermoleophilia bacterium]|nr:DUF2249 domain-containing protein [Thermoleophilia bacterium]
MSEQERPAWLDSAPVVLDIEARDMQHRGEDPFFTVMDAARGVGEGQAFRLRNTFAPYPLFGVLAKKGFAHWAEELGPDDWLITFFRERSVAAEQDADDTHPKGATRPATVPAVDAPATTAVPATAAADERDPAALLAADEPPAEHLVDAVVTILPEDLTPPLPMQLVLEGLAPVAAGGLLLVHHLRTPPHLMAKLEQQGHAYRIWDLGPDRKEILIHKAPEANG